MNSSQEERTFKGDAMPRSWTDEQKKEQARKISAWKPWSRSTGPRSDSGKARSAKNRALSLEAARAKVEALRREQAIAVSELERLTGKRKALQFFGTLAFHLNQIEKMIG